MRLLQTKTLLTGGFSTEETLFAELWGSMTHVQSLDSYRVRCLNSRTVVRELAQELRLDLIDDLELDALCEEALAILDADAVVKAHFPSTLKVLRPFLEKPPHRKDEKGKAASDEEQRRTFGFAAEDFSVVLEREYFSRLCEVCQAGIKPGNEDEISGFTGALLSDLVDQGWTLDALYRWHRHFFSGMPKPKYNFTQKLDFMLAQFRHHLQPFDVTLRLSGTDKLAPVRSYGGFVLSDKAPVAAESSREHKFFATHQQVYFATAKIQAVDTISAAIEARGLFEQLLDLLRFDYERRTVHIDETCFVRRCADGRRDMPRIVHAIPNPVETTTEEMFLRFAAEFDAVMKQNRLDEESRYQLQAALRQYRFGRDSEGYKDKFLNWWMGLEALSHVGRGKGIGLTVRHNVSRAMTKQYLCRMLSDLASTLAVSKVAWPSELAEHAGCPNLPELSVSQLLGILQSQQHLDLLCAQCGTHPLLRYRLRRLGGWLLDPKKTLSQLELHRRHLEWHLSRLYRIRCCIVHGTPVRLRLGLFAANLEYYLKQLIRFVLTAFHENQHLQNLDQLFRRSSIAYDRRVARLRDPNATADDVRAAVFADVVLKENTA